MWVGGSAKPKPPGCWSAPIKSQRRSGTRWALAPAPWEVVNTTQRCQVPSGWTGASHLLRNRPPYWQPALAGGAVATSPAAIAAAPRLAIKVAIPSGHVILNAIIASPSASIIAPRRRRHKVFAGPGLDPFEIEVGVATVVEGVL